MKGEDWAFGCFFAFCVFVVVLFIVAIFAVIYAGIDLAYENWG